MSARRYLARFATAFCTLAAATAMLNVLVDPYLVFGSTRLEGFNQVKTEINEYVHTAKAFEPFRRHTDVLLAGNSRVEMGLDPAHICFAQLQLNAYNLGIPGASVGQQLNFALNVIYSQPVQRVFLSVDFLDFLIDKGPLQGPQDTVVATANLSRRFDGSVNPQYAWATFQTRFQALLSLDALTSSIHTVLLQGAYRPDRLANGFNPAADFAKATSLEGPGALFQQKMASLRELLASPKSIYDADGELTHAFDLFSSFLATAGDYGVEVVVLTNPFHEQFWDLLREQELYEMHVDWRAEVEARVREARGWVTMWDFSEDSVFIHESVPSPGVKAPPLDWFWEPSHYRKGLGDKMLDSMLAAECGSQAVIGQQLSEPR